MQLHVQIFCRQFMADFFRFVKQISTGYVSVYFISFIFIYFIYLLFFFCNGGPKSLPIQCIGHSNYG